MRFEHQGASLFWERDSLPVLRKCLLKQMRFSKPYLAYCSFSLMPLWFSARSILEALAGILPVVSLGKFPTRATN